MESDYSDLLVLWERTGVGGAERDDDLEVINRCNALGGRLLVLVDEGSRLIGSSWMTQDGRRMFLHHFAVDPDYQGRGLSHLLMKESMAWMREQGMQIKLEVHRANEIAKALYLKYHFKDLGDYMIYIIRDIKKKGAE